VNLEKSHPLLLLLLLLFTAVEFSPGGSNPYSSTDKRSKNNILDFLEIGSVI
jgi:hypothetical protein